MTAVMMRCLSISGSARRGPQLFAGPAEAALALLIGSDGCGECFAIEVRPQQVGEIELRIGKLPQQKVADSMFAAGADEQIRLGRVSHGQIRRKGVRIESSGILRMFG